jgi:hypothetical protein
VRQKKIPCLVFGRVSKITLRTIQIALASNITQESVTKKCFAISVNE